MLRKKPPCNFCFHWQICDGRDCIHRPWRNNTSAETRGSWINNTSAEIHVQTQKEKTHIWANQWCVVQWSQWEAFHKTGMAEVFIHAVDSQHYIIHTCMPFISLITLTEHKKCRSLLWTMKNLYTRIILLFKLKKTYWFLVLCKSDWLGKELYRSQMQTRLSQNHRALPPVLFHLPTKYRTLWRCCL